MSVSRADGLRGGARAAAAWGMWLLLLGAPLAAGASPGWTDATGQAGIAYQQAGEIHLEPQGPHEPPDIGWPGFPEIMGGGACWVDVDNDGFEDLYVVNQRYNEENPAWGDWALEADTRNRLYINQGDGTYRDATDGSGADAHAFGYGCSAADYDADGCVDLFAANFGPSYLFRGRCDGTFANVTSALGPVGQDGACGDFRCMSTSSGWADYDRDGDLDLYVANYVETTLDDNLRGPEEHVAQFNFLLRNDGASFTEVAQDVGAAGYAQDEGGSKSLGVAWFDYDRDGWPDIYVANDEEPNNLFRNLGNGTFEEVAAAANVDNVFAGMGLSAGDYDNDGWQDLYFTHYSNEHNGFYRNLGDGTFQNRSGEDDLVQSFERVGWGTRFVDYDRDGWLDIVLTNGHTEWIVATYQQEFQVFRNEPEASPDGPGDRQWTDASNDTLLGFGGPRIVGRGLAFGDHDLDGDVDLFAVPNGNETALLLEGSGVANRWLYLQLRQPGMNREALGAVVTLQAGGLAQVREHYPGQSYLSQNSMLMEFGLGSAAKADEVSIAWPDGTHTLLHDLPADRVVRVVRGVPGFVTDTLAPRTTAALDGPLHEGWWRGEVTASLAAQDLAVGPASGVVHTEFSLDGGPWAGYQGPLAFDGEGVHVLRMRSRDAAGNQEPVRTVHVPIDATPPVPWHAVEGTLGLEGWHVTRPLVSLAALDAGSGPGPIRYRVNGGPWVTYEAAFTLADGIHDLEFVASDMAGNEAAPVAFQVRVDLTPPSVAPLRPVQGAVYVENLEVARLGKGPAVVLQAGALPFPLAAQASDAHSGIARVVFKLDGEVLFTEFRPPYDDAWDTTASAAGFHVLEFEAVDRAGQRASAQVRVLLVSASEGSIERTLQEGPALHGSPLGKLPLPLAAVALPLLARRWRGR